MVNLSRRGFLCGAGSALIVAPAIVKAKNIMPVKLMVPQPPKIEVYMDPWNHANNVVYAPYKGKSVFDAGLFYAPYVPLQVLKAYDPVIISILRRNMPNLIAYDICSVQPMQANVANVFSGGN